MLLAVMPLSLAVTRAVSGNEVPLEIERAADPGQLLARQASPRRPVAAGGDVGMLSAGGSRRSLRRTIRSARRDEEPSYVAQRRW